MLKDRDAYLRAFERERLMRYPAVDTFEQEMGYALDRDWLLEIARVLACPLKIHPPNWQHGRVLYAAARRYLAETGFIAVNALDIGTAKGFSALCLQRAFLDGRVAGLVTSVDVINPAERVSRNTVAEVDGLLTLAETLAPWPEAEAIQFVCSTGADFLREYSKRAHIVFVDGNHHRPGVQEEGIAISYRQRAGDLVMFDDVNLPDVAYVVHGLRSVYRWREVEVLRHRRYAVGHRC